MKIALFGASGMIGQRILREAVERGHTVTAIARDPSKITDSGPNIHAVKGDILDKAGVASLVAGHDAVVSAVAPSHDHPETVTDDTKSLIAGIKAAGVSRLFIVGGAGSLEVAPGVTLVEAPQFPAAWKGIALAHGDLLNYVRTLTDLDWTYFSPAALISPGTRTGKFRLGTDQLVADEAGESKISAEDYAVAVVDELEKPQFAQRRFTIGY